jgi:uncharacterized protein (DUF2249 family)
VTATVSSALIDVRTIPPRDRHPLIFTTFGKLDSGQALVLVNDHDPRPLRQVFESTLPGRFGWDYLEQGPDLWRVAITKLADADREAAEGNCCGGCCGA